MVKAKISESDLYPVVMRWAKKYFNCFQVNQDVGLRHSRADVFCVRDSGGDLTNDIETIVIEVKKNAGPFATASGQAYGYRVYANRVYLADYRDYPFSSAERQISAQLGIGLIQINPKLRCSEVQASPRYEPIPAMGSEILERVRLGTCRICGILFRTAEAGKGMSHKLLARESLEEAIKTNKGFMFWSYQLAKRKRTAGIKRYKGAKHETYERRFICDECIEILWAPMMSAT